MSCPALLAAGQDATAYAALHRRRAHRRPSGLASGRGSRHGAPYAGGG
ncbi:MULTISPECIES: hypothetical protein [Streptomyces]|nr:hypothetical protein [Streptomyces ruber]